jgi:hypothetical protein
MTKAVLLVLALTGAAAAARADVYRWTDAHGVTHYTSDINHVPASQRELARRTVPSGRGSVLRIGSGHPSAGAPAEPAASPSATAASAPPASAGEESVDGKTEAQWRNEASLARSRLERAEASAEHCKGDTFRASARSGHAQYEEEKTEADGCERIRAEAEGARQALEQLEERAHVDGVPPGWLRE